MKNSVDVAQNLRGLSYEVCSTNVATIFRIRIIYSSFGDMRHYTPAAFCYATRTYENSLYSFYHNIRSFTETQMFDLHKASFLNTTKQAL